MGTDPEKGGGHARRLAHGRIDGWVRSAGYSLLRRLFFDRMRSLESLTYLEEYSRYHARRDKEDEEEQE